LKDENVERSIDSGLPGRTESSPTADLLGEAGLQPQEVDLIIPTAVNAASWPLLLRRCGIPEERLYQPRSRFGHASATDSFILLEEAETTGRLQPGMRVLLFTFGLGAIWTMPRGIAAGLCGREHVPKALTKTLNTF
jgi:3-oxoacyl-[acyl-carrier-protein] synthase III